MSTWRNRTYPAKKQQVSNRLFGKSIIVENIGVFCVNKSFQIDATSMNLQLCVVPSDHTIVLSKTGKTFGLKSCGKLALLSMALLNAMDDQKVSGEIQ